jgi:hypothetical protein
LKQNSDFSHARKFIRFFRCFFSIKHWEAIFHRKSIKIVHLSHLHTKFLAQWRAFGSATSGKHKLLLLCFLLLFKFHIFYLYQWMKRKFLPFAHARNFLVLFFNFFWWKFIFHSVFLVQGHWSETDEGKKSTFPLFSAMFFMYLG